MQSLATSSRTMGTGTRARRTSLHKAGTTTRAGHPRAGTTMVGPPKAGTTALKAGTTTSTGASQKMKPPSPRQAKPVLSIKLYNGISEVASFNFSGHTGRDSNILQHSGHNTTAKIWNQSQKIRNTATESACNWGSVEIELQCSRRKAGRKITRRA